jgi:hypothetical protein
VLVTGEFLQGDPQDIPMTRLGQSGIFAHSVEFREPVRVEYEFVVDGQWLVDPLCPNVVDNGVGEQNSCCVAGDVQEPAQRERRQR